MADQWLSIVEYARETGISDMTIRRRIRTGRIAAELRDGKYFIPVTVDQSNGQVSPVKTAGFHSQAAKTNHGLLKAHPSPGRTIPQVIQASPIIESSRFEAASQTRDVTSSQVAQNSGHHSSASVMAATNGSASLTPDSLVKPLIDAGIASVEARSLIEFCHDALEQARSTVASVEARYIARLEAANAQLAQKNQELKSLNQQVEDLQLLVQILERKK
jgi:hypothetical protein